MDELEDGDLVVITDVQVFEVRAVEECTYCGNEVRMMMMKGTGFCGRLCEEYEYWEEMQDADETESP